MTGHRHQDGQAKETSVVLSVGAPRVVVVEGPGATRVGQGREEAKEKKILMLCQHRREVGVVGWKGWQGNIKKIGQTT